jgi:hypothetical protein
MRNNQPRKTHKRQGNFIFPPAQALDGRRRADDSALARGHTPGATHYQRRRIEASEQARSRASRLRDKSAADFRTLVTTPKDVPLTNGVARFIDDEPRVPDSPPPAPRLRIPPKERKRYIMSDSTAARFRTASVSAGLISQHRRAELPGDRKHHFPPVIAVDAKSLDEGVQEATEDAVDAKSLDEGGAEAIEDAVEVGSLNEGGAEAIKNAVEVKAADKPEYRVVVDGDGFVESGDDEYEDYEDGEDSDDASDDDENGIRRGEAPPEVSEDDDELLYSTYVRPPVKPRIRSFDRIHQFWFLISMWRCTYYVPRRAFIMLCAILSLLVNTLRGVRQVSRSTQKTIDADLGVPTDNFERRATCPRCWTMFPASEITREVVLTDPTTKKETISEVVMSCPTIIMGKRCKEPLSTPVPQEDETVKFAARVSTCMRDLKSCIVAAVDQSDFVDAARSWQKRASAPGVSYDLYDGKVWKEMWKKYGAPFEARSVLLGAQYVFLMISLNIDWFAPFGRVPYSVGVVYWTILNFDRKRRYRVGSIIISHILPGGKEKGVNLRNFFAGVVEDLVVLWAGLALKRFGMEDVVVKVALIMFHCDQPALRKVLGFVGAAGMRGCTKCQCVFKRARSVKSPWIAKGKRKGEDNIVQHCGGFSKEDQAEWTSRNHTHHAENCAEFLLQLNPTQQKNFTRECGCTETAFTDKRLSYMDAIRFNAMDVMHLIYMGTGKKILWLIHTMGGLTKQKLAILQIMVKRVLFPRDVSSGFRNSIEGKFTGMTAAQVRVFWACLAEPFLDEDFLGPMFKPVMRALVVEFAHLVRLLSAASLTDDRIVEIKLTALCVCRLMEASWGPTAISINQHMMVHLDKVISDYGPPHAYILFALERMNGWLKNIPYNASAYEISLFCHIARLESMTGDRGLARRCVGFTDGADVLYDEMKSAFHESVDQQEPAVQPLSADDVCRLARDGLSGRHIEPIVSVDWPFDYIGCESHMCIRLTYDKPIVTRGGSSTGRSVLPAADHKLLQVYFARMVGGDASVHVDVPSLVKRSKLATIAGEVYGVTSSRSCRTARVLVSHGATGQKWTYADKLADPTDPAIKVTKHQDLWPAEVRYYCRVVIQNATPLAVKLRLRYPMRTNGNCTDSGALTFDFAVVKWYRPQKVILLPDVDESSVLMRTYNAGVYHESNFETADWSAVVPLGCLRGRFAAALLTDRDRVEGGWTNKLGPVKFRAIAIPRKVFII